MRGQSSRKSLNTRNAMPKHTRKYTLHTHKSHLGLSSRRVLSALKPNLMLIFTSLGRRLRLNLMFFFNNVVYSSHSEIHIRAILIGTTRITQSSYDTQKHKLRNTRTHLCTTVEAQHMRDKYALSFALTHSTRWAKWTSDSSLPFFYLSFSLSLSLYRVPFAPKPCGDGYRLVRARRNKHSFLGYWAWDSFLRCAKKKTPGGSK